MKNLRPAIAAVFMAAMMLAAALIKPFEGKSNVAYQDSVGIWTICRGHTLGVYEGMTATDAECDEFFQQDLTKAFNAVSRHVTVDLPAPRLAALASFEFNVGEENFARSSVVRKINAGDTVGGCNALLQWDHAGGRELAGLKRRREAERQLCLKGAV